MTVAIDTLRSAGVLSPLDEHFARAMARIGGDPREEVMLAAAMASHQVGNGHVCLDLPRLAEMEVLYNDAGEPVAEHPWPPLDQWREVLRSSPLVGDGNAVTPFVLDDAGRLYLRRYWEHEARLAAALRERAVQVDASLDGSWLRTTLDRLFPDSVARRAAEPDWQRMAALLALQRRFCVISGGPGTGKTFTVVKILALLTEQAMHAGARTPRVTLVAPTGKAAARLSESIRKARSTLPCSSAVRDAIPEDAATIHRCLGSIAGSSTDFRHQARNPLVTDVVLVDEASMVDVALMSRLVAAVPPRARLILLGDQDQLASVEAGAVLGDICNTGAPRSYSQALVEQVAQLTGDQLPRSAGAPRATGIWDCIVQLTHSYRYGPQSGIGTLARAINSGDAGTALEILKSGDYRNVARVQPEEGEELSEELRAAALRGFGSYLHTQQPLERLRALEKFRVLCAHRRGPMGVERVNGQIEAALADAGLIRPDSSAYVGRPVLVTRNDYQIELFNGDVGIIVDDPERTAGKLALFLGAAETVRRLSPSRLPPHETVFAMSVHKSQGSEFDEVAVLLPERISAVVTRELLYTAVTRARHKVTVYASREMVKHAITHRIERGSGLRDRLWG
ncbi:MAG: exodeoxyribonuclease V subunit alpha [Candidatus Binatia bacterium]|jgi:exodeoxyribonuclease V alpha subunit